MNDRMIQYYERYLEPLNLDVVRKHIEHTIGEHIPNVDNQLLCNGHCGWDKCKELRGKCIGCAYIECITCNEEFTWKIEDKFRDHDDRVFSYCRDCGHVNTIRFDV